MEKQIIVSTISEKLKQMGINLSTGSGTDITVNTEFLDAGWNTGDKKISYEASIFADEETNTVFMWEMTKEVGHGLSFGGQSGSYSQRGTTLFRKVKSVQYGFEGKATLTGWIVSPAVFAVCFFIQRKLAQKGCLLNLILWIVTGFILLVVLTVVTTESLSFTTANIKNAHMTTAMDSTGKPADKVKSYTADASELVSAAELHNAPENTKVKFVWTYVTGNMPITEFVVDSGDKETDVYVFSTLTNDKPWPKGQYKVEIYIEDRDAPDAAVNFEVTD